MHVTSEPMDLRLWYLVWSQGDLSTNTLYNTPFKIRTLINKKGDEDGAKLWTVYLTI
jgi:hypothetical protein